MVACLGEVGEAQCPVWGQRWMAEGLRVAAPWRWDGSPQADYRVDLTAAPGSWSLQVSMDSSMAATVGEPRRAQVGMSVGNAEAERVLAVPAGVEFAGAGESLDLVGLRHAQRELRASRSYARYCTDQAWRVIGPPEERAVAPAAPEGSWGVSPRGNPEQEAWEEAYSDSVAAARRCLHSAADTASRREKSDPERLRGRHRLVSRVSAAEAICSGMVVRLPQAARHKRPTYLRALLCRKSVWVEGRRSFGNRLVRSVMMPGKAQGIRLVKFVYAIQVARRCGDAGILAVTSPGLWRSNGGSISRNGNSGWPRRDIDGRRWRV